MTVLSSFWVVMSYEVKEPDGTWQRYWWYCAIMEINMLNAFRRLATDNGKIDCEVDSRHWCGHHEPNRFGGRTEFEVFMQDEKPEIPEDRKNFITVHDHRTTEMRREAERSSRHAAEKPREGFKKLPIQLSFGKK